MKKNHRSLIVSVLMVTALLAACGPDGEKGTTQIEFPETDATVKTDGDLPDNVEEKPGKTSSEDVNVKAEQSKEKEPAKVAYDKLKGDERILTKAYLNEIKTGVMPDTGGIGIGSTMDEVKAQYGEPIAEDTYEGAYFHDYGEIVVYYAFPEGEEVLRIDRRFETPQLIANITNAWGQPDEAVPLYPEAEEQMLVYESEDFVAYVEIGGDFGTEAAGVILKKNWMNAADAG